MKTLSVGPLLRVLFMIACLCAFGARAHAQGKPPGGPPPAPGSPGGPGGPGGPAGPGGGSPPPGALGNAAGSVRSNNGTHSTLQFGPPGRWWDDKSTVKVVGLSRDQQKKMDSIFDSNKAAILDSYKALLNERAKLDAMTKASQVDQARLFAQIDVVNQAHSTLEKANAQMLLDIRQQMDQHQIEKLGKITAKSP